MSLRVHPHHSPLTGHGTTTKPMQLRKLIKELGLITHSDYVGRRG